MRNVDKYSGGNFMNGAWYFIGIVIGIVIWYFINRASVRANRQIELLESIDRQLSIISGKESIDEKRLKNRNESKSASKIPEESRKNVGL